MDDSSEEQLWKSIELTQRRIRERVFRMGMAGRFHIGKGTDILRDLELIDRYVMQFDDEIHAAEYLSALPDLIEQTAYQDSRCAELWDSRASHGSGDYPQEQAKLAELLLKFKYTLRSYERLVRQPDKPFLRRAVQLLAKGTEAGSDVYKLESLLRLTLREFVNLEEATADDLPLLDELRAEIVSAHEGFARTMAETIAGPEPEAARYAICGLSKAAENYSDRRGYRFRTYAEFWIETAVREKKTWGLS